MLFCECLIAFKSKINGNHLQVALYIKLWSHEFHKFKFGLSQLWYLKMEGRFVLWWRAFVIYDYKMEISCLIFLLK